MHKLFYLEICYISPAIKVLAPMDFKNRFIDRIRKQMGMINKPQE
jgi:hypothetical protein